jgi:hypothetical protein
LELVSVRLTVGYTDGHKCQDWKRDKIDRIDRLVFRETLMEPREKRKFRPRRDWRKNPCLAIYWADSTHPKLICQRGSLGHKRRNSKERGIPIGLDLIYKNTQAQECILSFDKAWLADTGQLEFDRRSDGIAIVRHHANGAEPVIISASMGKAEPLFVPPGSEGFRDNWPCGEKSIMGTEFF